MASKDLYVEHPLDHQQGLIPYVPESQPLSKLIQKRVKQITRGWYLGIKDVQKHTWMQLLILHKKIKKYIISGTGSTIKRVLASFDQLDRLASPSGGAGIFQLEKPKWLEELSEYPSQTLPQYLEQSAQLVQQAFAKLEGTTKNTILHTQALRGVLEELGISAQQLYPASYIAASAAADMSNAFQSAGGRVMAAAMLVEDLGTAINTTAWDTEAFADTAAAASEKIQTVWLHAQSVFSGVVAQMRQDADGIWAGLYNGGATTWEKIQAVFSGAKQFFYNTFSQAWRGVVDVFSVGGEVFTDIKDGVLTGFKQVVNQLIRGINNVVSLPFQTLNTRLAQLKSFRIGNLTPFAGMNWTVSVPKIPYLAKGAVLPANKPFMAVLGDQRHGTNIEAPLATIQEAVALVMQDYAGSNLAAQQGIIGLLQDILEAVLGIRIGDDVIAGAVNRYEQKMAVMGGAWV